MSPSSIVTIGLPEIKPSLQCEETQATELVMDDYNWSFDSFCLT